jgi:asparagine synthase (glutamine-hydrolysing)
MCGILFYIKDQFTETPDTTLLKLRGPDAYNEITLFNKFVFCFARLAIIKKENKGIQPIYYNGWYILCNGEIFNYLSLAEHFKIDKDLLETDVDILLHLDPNNIHEWAHLLRGDFSAIIFNYHTHHYFVIRDQTGVRPLYIGFNKNKEPIAFSSNLTSIKDAAFFQEFPPGNIYSSAEGEYTPYNNFGNIVADIKSATFAKQLIYSQLYESVYLRMIHTDVPMAFLCSGGVDSSILLTIGVDIWTNRLQRKREDLHCFTIEFMDSTCQSSDAFYARLLTKELNIQHTVFSFTINDIEEHLADILDILETDDYRSLRAAIPQYFLAKYISKHTPFKVIISGEGADELFLGYNYMFKCPSEYQAEDESVRLIKQMHKYDILRADRSISSWGLELRVPFLDSDFINTVLSISGNLRNTNKEKEILRASFKHNLALQNTRIIDRGKEKFSDGCSLSYIPSLIKLIASFYIDNINETSAHLLEKYEQEFVQEYYKFGDKIKSKFKDRELPDWCSNPTPQQNNKNSLFIIPDIETEKNMPILYKEYNPYEFINDLTQCPF